MASTVNRYKVLILFGGLIFAVLLGAFSANRLVRAPEFCVKCHDMKPEYVTWHASSHKQFSCVECHSVKKLILYFNPAQGTVQMDNLIGDEVCTKCHSNKRTITPSGDLIVPHDTHAAKKVMCMQCHSGVGHGNIVARKVAEEVETVMWTPELGAQQMSPEFTEPKMNVCLDCHIKRSVTQACEACHTNISLPPDHKEKGWGTEHGKKARTDLPYCNKCHSYSLEAKDVPVEDQLVRYARGNVFCYDCHQTRPAGHVGDWNMVHKRDVQNGDVSGCVVCHNVKKPTPQERAVPTYCGKCHGNQISDNKPAESTGTPTFSKLHPPDWRKIHPSIVKEKGVANEGCWNCHDTTHCSKCHMNKL